MVTNWFSTTAHTTVWGFIGPSAVATPRMYWVYSVLGLLPRKVFVYALGFLVPVGRKIALLETRSRQIDAGRNWQ